MPKQTGPLKQLRQYVEDLEMGVAMRLDDLAARLEAVERNLAAIGKHLDPGTRPDPDGAAPADSDRERGDDHA